MPGPGIRSNGFFGLMDYPNLSMSLKMNILVGPVLGNSDPEPPADAKLFECPKETERLAFLLGLLAESIGGLVVDCYIWRNSSVSGSMKYEPGPGCI